MPRRSERRRSQSWALWYMMLGATTCWPFSRVSKTATIAAIPEAKALASAPSSSSAATASSRSLLGPPERL